MGDMVRSKFAGMGLVPCVRPEVSDLFETLGRVYHESK